MSEFIVDFVSQFPPVLATMLLAAVPVGELRLAIPVASHLWLIDPLNAYALAVIGNLLPFLPLFFGLEKVRNFLETHVPSVGKALNYSVDRAKSRVEKKYVKYGALSLFLFTAIPLPLTGLWSATLAAVALKVPFKYASIGIIAGVAVSGIIVSLFSLSPNLF